MADTQQKSKSQKIITFVFIILFVVACVGLIMQIIARQNMPQSVIVDAGSPLTCNLLEAPKTIGNLTAVYGCQAPGAYLSSVDINEFSAQYFTTDSQGTKATYGPNSVQILSYK